MLFDTIKAFLERTSLEGFLSTHQNPLLVIEKNASVGMALQLLQQNKILSLPVIDEGGEYAGCISVNDILRGLHRTLTANLGDNYIDEVEMGTVTAEELTDVGFFFIGKQVSSLLHDADIWMKGDASTTLLTVIKEGFQVKGPKVHHRIYVCDPNKPSTKSINQRGATTVVNNQKGTQAEGSSAWTPTDVVSQSDVVKLLWDNREELGLASSTTLRDLGLSDGACLSVNCHTPAIVAFDHMAVDHKSSVGIVDDDGHLIGNLSASDIRDLPIGNFGLLLLPVYQYIAAVHGFEALALQGSPSDLLAKLPPVTVTQKTTFGELVEKLVTTGATTHSRYRGLHRVYVVDSAGRPASIVTLTDVLRTVVKFDDIPKSAIKDDGTMFGRVKGFLANETLEHFINTHQKPLSVIDNLASVGTALQLLQTKRVLSVPVIDEDGEYKGSLSVNDIIRGLHKTLAVNLGDNYIDELEQNKVTAQELNNIGFFFIGKQVASLMHDADIWMKGDASTTLLTVIKEGFQIMGPKVHHRIYVCDPKKPAKLHLPRSRGGSRVGSRGDLTTLAGAGGNQRGSQGNLLTLAGQRGSQGNLQTLSGRGSQANLQGMGRGSQANLQGMGGQRGSQVNLQAVGSRQDLQSMMDQKGNVWKPTDVVSLSDVVKFLWDNRNELGLASSISIEELGLSDGACLSVNANTLAIVAFDHMAVDHKSSVAIVDDSGKLIGNLSASDIRDLPVTNFGLLLLPVYKYVAQMRGYADADCGSPADLLAKLPPVCVTPSSTFAELVEKLVQTGATTHHQFRGLHRVYVIDAAGKPISIITLSDVLRTIVKFDDILHADDAHKEDDDDDDDDDEEDDAADDK